MESLIALVGLVVFGALIYAGYTYVRARRRGESPSAQRLVVLLVAFFGLVAVSPDETPSGVQAPSSAVATPTPATVADDSDAVEKVREEAAAAKAEAVEARKEANREKARRERAVEERKAANRAKARAENAKRQAAAAAAFADIPEEAPVDGGGGSPSYAGMTCDEIGHSFTVPPGSDPDHDADNDGVACESQ